MNSIFNAVEVLQVLYQAQPSETVLLTCKLSVVLGCVCLAIAVLVNLGSKENP